MGGFFGVASKKDCVLDVYFGVDYHTHLGTRRGGMMIYDDLKQGTKAGGSGCGCSGSVFCGYYYKMLMKKQFRKILFIPTGALMSTTTAQQGDPIMGIAHCVAIEI